MPERGVAEALGLEIVLFHRSIRLKGAFRVVVTLRLGAIEIADNRFVVTALFRAMTVSKAVSGKNAGTEAARG